MRRLVRGTIIAVALAAAATTLAAASGPGADVRLSNDIAGGYTSAYTLAGHGAYSDGVLAECSGSRGRQNEPSVAIDPRNTRGDRRLVERLLRRLQHLGRGRRAAAYRADLARLLPFAERRQRLPVLARARLSRRHVTVCRPLAHIRTRELRRSGAGVGQAMDDCSLARSRSEDPAGTRRASATSGSRRYGNPGGGTSDTTARSTSARSTVAKGSSAPGTGGKFNDKTAIEVDRTE